MSHLLSRVGPCWSDSRGEKIELVAREAAEKHSFSAAVKGRGLGGSFDEKAPKDFFISLLD